MDNNNKYCVIYKDEEKKEWKREFFTNSEKAHEFLKKLSPDCKAFLRQFVVIGNGSRKFFETFEAAEKAALKGDSISVLNPMIKDLPPELLYC